MHPKVDEYISKLSHFQDEMEKLRAIALDCGLTEEYKWAKPCYMYGKNNILIIIPLKNHCVIGLFKGELLQDPEGILVKPGENTQGGRQIRLKNMQEIIEKQDILKAYIFEAIEVEKAGLQIEPHQAPEISIPEELKQKFEEMPALQTAFEALTPGRQRAYLIHFAEAKQSATRTARIEKYTERILKVKGILDCICGHSKRMPNCDGSHKHYS